MRSLDRVVKAILLRFGHERLGGFAALGLAVWLTVPVAVRFPLGRPPADPGIQELQSLVASSGGHPSRDDLVRIESKYNRMRAGVLAQFLRGYLAYSDKDYPAAINALDAKAIDAHSSIGSYALYYRAESEEASGKSSAALSDYQSLYGKYPDSLVSHEARFGAVRMLLAGNDPQALVKPLVQLQEMKDAEAIFLAGCAAEKIGDRDQAITLYRTVYFRHAASSAAAQAKQALDAIGTSIADNPGSQDEVLSRADRLFDSKQYAEAASAYNDLMTRYPAAARSDEVQLRCGISLMNSRELSEASTCLQKVSEADPDRHAEALYYRSEVARRANQDAEGSTITDRLISQHHQSKWAALALYNLATSLDKHGRAGEAAARFRQIVSSYPNSEYAPEASYNLGWQAYKSGRYAEAARILEQHLATYHYPDSKFLGESGFWGARAEERVGSKARALAIYSFVAQRFQYGYHGYVAARRAAALRKDNPGLSPESVKPGSDLERIQQNLTRVDPPVETADGSEAPYSKRADDLEVIGLTDLAVKELNRPLENAPSSPKINLRLAELYSRKGDPLQATLVLRRAYPDLFSYSDADLPREAWEIFFPLHHWDTIKQEARGYGIDPYVAAALIRQESVFNPNAISRVGARGLMQLMPATGQLIAKRQQVGSITAADLYNPSINIKLGMNYLAQLLGQFGKIEYAAAAYNAGPGRARQWIAERGSLEMDEWVETIPFSETRGYVQAVLRNAANYRRLYK
ncbi:MAG TPA: transglycosylase SLT domain-containing protein [Blastocatellia bacterium]|nr:transglycosylase SLT domain-containing protein [Blastocatellia bacterium]